MTMEDLGFKFGHAEIVVAKSYDLAIKDLRQGIVQIVANSINQPTTSTSVADVRNVRSQTF